MIKFEYEILENKPIDYELLAKAVNYYRTLGYEQIEVPWVVSREASLETAKIDSLVYETNYGEHLVGSAEQGFVELLMHDVSRLSCDKSYFTVSPCFRRDNPDHVYSRWFIKLELFQWVEQNPPILVVREFLKNAQTLFNGINQREEVVVVHDEVNKCIDLMYENLELGSYGFRSLKDGPTWVYGTGVALPRLQLIKDK